MLQPPGGRVMMSGLSHHEDGQQNAEQHSERLAVMGTRCHHIVMLSGSYYVRNTMIGPGCFIRIQSKTKAPDPETGLAIARASPPLSSPVASAADGISKPL
jgi:hypothetical protein